MQKIIPFLWFNNNAEEAIELYTAIFKDAQVSDIKRYGEGGPVPAGTLLTATFRLEGQEFMVMNGGPMFSFTEAVSFFVRCETQEEVDFFWEKLSEGGQVQQCGWLKDRFGLSWQIIPTILGKLMSDTDQRKARNVIQAMMQMKKIDIQGLQYAYNQTTS